MMIQGVTDDKVILFQSRIFQIFRKLFEVAGVSDKIETSHLNSRGANKKSPEEIAELFKNSSRKVVTAIINRYYADFR